MVDWKDPLYQKIIVQLPHGTMPGDYITSLEITARKQAHVRARPRPLLRSQRRGLLQLEHVSDLDSHPIDS
jgi:hypothetical protein